MAQLKVVEKFVAVFPEYDQNRGIERAIPTKYKKNNLDLKIESVQNEYAIDRNYTTYESNDNLVLRIGDADSYVRGRQVYTITYTMRDVITFMISKMNGTGM